MFKEMVITFARHPASNFQPIKKLKVSFPFHSSILWKTETLLAGGRGVDGGGGGGGGT